jgi:lipoate-protein ligase A
MWKYIESGSLDPRYNLALEQYVFDSLDKKNSYFMLWQNHNSVIVGKNQNTTAEINQEFIDAHNISVIRRLSGGGAVYHDMGNLNYSIISDSDGIDFDKFCIPVQKALLSLGIPVKITGRNDMAINGLKISGSAQYIKKGRALHHGTLLYDTNLKMLNSALNVTENKSVSHGIKSVKSRVTNIKPYMKTVMSINEFKDAVKDYFFSCYGMKEHNLSASENEQIEKIKENVYSDHNWNYGSFVKHNIRKTCRIEGCGSIQVLMEINKDGLINNIDFYGDFFGTKDCRELANMFIGCKLDYNEVSTVLEKIDISGYFFNADNETFMSLLLQ